jgi:hypothetical protein
MAGISPPPGIINIPCPNKATAVLRVVILIVEDFGSFIGFIPTGSATGRPAREA